MTAMPLSDVLPEVLPEAAARLPNYSDLLAHARHPGEQLTKAFAGAIASGLGNGRRPLIFGLAESEFERLMQRFFPGLRLSNGTCQAHGAIDEYDDLVLLLMEHRRQPTTDLEWLSRTIASACRYDNHLWQDMGLPNRAALGELMRTQFSSLAAKNVGDMKWKKFFYRQLCERAEILICKSPHCAECSDYLICFGPEE